MPLVRSYARRSEGRNEWGAGHAALPLAPCGRKHARFEKCGRKTKPTSLGPRELLPPAPRWRWLLRAPDVLLDIASTATARGSGRHDEEHPRTPERDRKRMERIAPLIAEHSRLQEAEKLLAEIAERAASEVPGAKAAPRRAGARRRRGPRQREGPIVAESRSGRNDLQDGVLNAIVAAGRINRPKIAAITGATLNAVYPVTGELRAEGRIEIRGCELFAVKDGTDPEGSARTKRRAMARLMRRQL